MDLIIEDVCQNCGRRFSFSPKRSFRRRRFCGRRCAIAFREGRMERLCPVCSKSFSITMGEGFRLTCSEECSRVWMSKSWDELRGLKVDERFLNRRPPVCQVCGYSEVVYIVPIIPQSGGGSLAPDNLALLCPNCHKLYRLGLMAPEELRRRIQKYISGISVKRVVFHHDSRGHLGELLTRRDPIWIQPAHIYITTVRSDVVKGWHIHQRQTDNFFCLSGSIQLALFDARPLSPTFGLVSEFIMGELNPLLVQIPPGVIHGFKGLSPAEGEAMVLNLTDRVYDPNQPDEFRIFPHRGEEQRRDLMRLGLPFGEGIPYDWTKKDG